MTDTEREPKSPEAPTAVRDDRLPCSANDDEPMGGDPPCWAHLFEDDTPPTDQ